MISKFPVSQLPRTVSSLGHLQGVMDAVFDLVIINRT